MRYRTNRRTGDEISEIGLGSSYLCDAKMEEGIRALHTAYEGGINYYDLAAGHGRAFAMYGEAFQGIRQNVFFQIHFGADYSRGEYGWSLNLADVKRSVKGMLRDLQTDYIDYGFIHCQDEVSDWETFQKNGVYDYLMDLKKKGTVRHIGLSSHTPSVIQRILDEADVDMLMFSINPGYDYQKGEYAHGGLDERTALYRRCEAEQIGISVMKPFSGGQLLDAKISPFPVALTKFQCIRYALDKPGVLTVLPGASSEEEVRQLLAYETASDEETDYALISTFAPVEQIGTCVYCSHCQPCPMNLEIGLINKYYDLSVSGDSLSREHYLTLNHTASECISCGHCDRRCPFSVRQSQRMKEIADYFGK